MEAHKGGGSNARSQQHVFKRLLPSAYASAGGSGGTDAEEETAAAAAATAAARGEAPTPRERRRAPAGRAMAELTEGLPF